MTETPLTRTPLTQPLTQTPLTGGTDPDQLFALLPAVHRMRDADGTGLLAALLRVITEQVQVVDDDLAQLYENWFVETCEPWVVPYLAELLGADSGRFPVLPARRQVAATLGARRRKGTLALLEDLAGDVAGWPARAVEFRRLLAGTVSINHPRYDRGRTLDLRDCTLLDGLGGPFEAAAHTLAVGRIEGPRKDRFNIPTVGLFVWRLRPYSVTHAPAHCVDRARNRFTFNLLGIDTPLLTAPIAEPAPTHIADESNVPNPIGRRALAERTGDLYGPGQSIQVWRDSPDRRVPLREVIAADLSDWSFRPRGNQLAIDPVLGRMVFSDAHPPRRVWVSYRYGFAADLGGGEYSRPLSDPAGASVYGVGSGQQHHGIMAAVEHWNLDRATDPTLTSAIVEIRDSGEYPEPLKLTVPSGTRLEIRAAAGCRPVIRVLDRYYAEADAWWIRGTPPGEAAGEGGQAQGELSEPPALPVLTLDGLLVIGRSVTVNGRFGCVTIRHCTLVPGWSLDEHCEPRSDEPSLVLEHTGARIRIEHSILGPVRVAERRGFGEPLQMCISDSAVDATSDTACAISGYDTPCSVELILLRSTVIGQLVADTVLLAENSIVTGPLLVSRRDIGCVRFCSTGPGSRTPARYECQPEGAASAIADLFARGELTPPERDQELALQPARVRPQFRSVRYGTAAYLQLAARCAPEISAGASDQSELGVFHDLFQPQRTTALQGALLDFTPAGSNAGILFAT